MPMMIMMVMVVAVAMGSLETPKEESLMTLQKMRNHEQALGW